MRDFNFDKDVTNASAANIAGAGLEQQPPDSFRLEEPVRENASLNVFHKSENDEKESGNTAAKITGAVIVGLLLVGGGIYAYESSSANRTPQTVAMLPPAPKNVTAAQQTPTAPPAATPDVSATPAPGASSPVSTAKPVRSSRSGLALATPASTGQDAAINQPITPTPDTAPPAEQSSGNSSQTAMQQPITVPNVSDQTAQPTPEGTNNNTSSGVILPSGGTILPDMPQPVQSDTSQPAQPDQATPSSPQAQ